MDIHKMISLRDKDEVAMAVNEEELDMIEITDESLGMENTELGVTDDCNESIDVIHNCITMLTSGDIEGEDAKNDEGAHSNDDLSKKCGMIFLAFELFVNLHH